MDSCQYCLLKVGFSPETSYVSCVNCKSVVHITCLKHHKLTLVCDTFFHFTCIRCSRTRKEELVRETFTWNHVIVLAIYNLKHLENSSNRNGYYHWRIHICKFIERHWRVLFGRKKKVRNWHAAVAGALPHGSMYFKCGKKELGDSGWWTLISPYWPQKIILDYKTNKFGPIQNVESHVMEIPKNMPAHSNQISVDSADEDMCEGESLDSNLSSAGSDGHKHTLIQQRIEERICKWPWQEYLLKEVKRESSAPMKEHEEQAMLRTLSCKVSNCKSDSIPAGVRRLYRKLIVRKIKRENNIPLFSLSSNQQMLSSFKSRILDRYKCILGSHELKQNCFVIDSVPDKDIGILSPYTHRMLKPYIRVDYDTTPLWIKLMQDIAKVKGLTPPPRSPLIYSYIQPHHIPAINTLCSLYFWPVDLSDSLQYPDFSCVVTYKRLVVAFALMVPDVTCSEAYISFIFTRSEWRRSYIGSFMLYHLIHTCLGKDITLHCSTTNPAVLLYQKFGFKVEEHILDFYDKYLPSESKECKHAVFLRLRR